MKLLEGGGAWKAPMTPKFLGPAAGRCWTWIEWMYAVISSRGTAATLDWVPAARAAPAEHVMHHHIPSSSPVEWNTQERATVCAVLRQALSYRRSRSDAIAKMWEMDSAKNEPYPASSKSGVLFHLRSRSRGFMPGRARATRPKGWQILRVNREAGDRRESHTPPPQCPASSGWRREATRGTATDPIARRRAPKKSRDPLRLGQLGAPAPVTATRSGQTVRNREVVVHQCRATSRHAGARDHHRGRERARPRRGARRQPSTAAATAAERRRPAPGPRSGSGSETAYIRTAGAVGAAVAKWLGALSAVGRLEEPRRLGLPVRTATAGRCRGRVPEYYLHLILPVLELEVDGGVAVEPLDVRPDDPCHATSPAVLAHLLESVW